MANATKKTSEKDTYCEGPSFVTHTKGLTTKDVVALCVHLNHAFGEGYEFVPEPITEGGILMKNWPEKQQKQYKTIRFGVDRNSGGSGWPWIREDTFEKWKSDEKDNLLFASTASISSKANASMEMKMGTFLKAFNGAPVWTIEELAKVEECFAKIGFRRSGKRPAKKSLSQSAITIRS